MGETAPYPGRSLRPALLLAACALNAVAARPDPPREEESMQCGSAAARASMEVDARRVTGAVHPFVYGQQLEFMGPCIDGGVWAELLEDRKFGIPDENGDGVSDGWTPVGPGGFALDDRAAACGPWSQRVTVSGKPVGLRQEHVPARRNRSYTGYVLLRAADFSGRVQAGLARGDGPAYAYAEIGPVGSEWSRLGFSFTSPVDDPRAGFQLIFEGTGAVWVGPVSLMCADHENGLDKGVMDLLRRVRPPHMRWPGGCYADHYHFEQALGPRDKRPMTYDKMWMDWSPNDFGTDEFIAFCRALGAAPSITLNVRTGAAEEAAAWVEYCNGSPGTKWGKVRAENGHPEPYDVKYWSIGNECWDYMTAEEYARKVAEYAPLVRAADPGVVLCAVGGRIEWDETVTRAVGDQVDWISQHYYFPATWAGDYPSDEAETEAILSRPFLLEADLRDVRRTLDAAAGRKLWIALDEWNVWPVNPRLRPMLKPGTWEGAKDAPLAAVILDLQRNFALREGLHACTVFHTLYRMTDDIIGANLFTSCNELGAIRTDGQSAYPTPVHLAFDLYRNHSGERVLLTEAHCALTTRCRYNDEDKPVPALDAVATFAARGERLFLHVVNRSLTEAIHADIRIDGFDPLPEAVAYTLTADHWSAENSYGHPDRVVVAEEPVREVSARFRYRFPKHSATTIELAAGGGHQQDADAEAEPPNRDARRDVSRIDKPRRRVVSSTHAGA